MTYNFSANEQIINSKANVDSPMQILNTGKWEIYYGYYGFYSF